MSIFKKRTRINLYKIQSAFLNLSLDQQKEIVKFTEKFKVQPPKIVFRYEILKNFLLDEDTNLDFDNFSKLYTPGIMLLLSILYKNNFDSDFLFNIENSINYYKKNIIFTSTVPFSGKNIILRMIMKYASKNSILYSENYSKKENAIEKYNSIPYITSTMNDDKKDPYSLTCKFTEPVSKHVLKFINSITNNNYAIITPIHYLILLHISSMYSNFENVQFGDVVSICDFTFKPFIFKFLKDLPILDDDNCVKDFDALLEISSDKLLLTSKNLDLDVFENIRIGSF